jgi:hypothetical protein
MILTRRERTLRAIALALAVSATTERRTSSARHSAERCAGCELTSLPMESGSRASFASACCDVGFSHSSLGYLSIGSGVTMENAPQSAFFGHCNIERSRETGGVLVIRAMRQTSSC